MSEGNTATRSSGTPLSDVASTQSYGVKLLTAIEAAWLAGIIDGEGSIYISKVKARHVKRGFIYAPYLGVANTGRALVVKVREIIGAGYVGRRKEDRHNWSDLHEYKGSASVLRGILPQILPYLVIKEDVAKKMLEFLAFVEVNSPDGQGSSPSYDAIVESLFLNVKRLNQKGKDLSRADLAVASVPFNLNKRKPGQRVKKCRKLSQTERAWLAGVIDGEGSIFISLAANPAYRRGFFYRPQLLVSNSDRQFLIRISEVIGEGTVHRAKKGDDRTRTRWEYVATAGVLRTVLPQILPYLIVKREQAKTMLDYFEFIDTHPLWGLKSVHPSYYDSLDSIYRKLKELNKKGKIN